MVDIYVIISVVITAIVVGVPFFYGAKNAIQKAVTQSEKQHQDKFSQFVAGLNAAIKYYEQHPEQDKEIQNIIIELAKLAGIVIPSALSG